MHKAEVVGMWCCVSTRPRLFKKQEKNNCFEGKRQRKERVTRTHCFSLWV